jgi:pimeloyl-ACP methyl ester carboxylesterase
MIMAKANANGIEIEYDTFGNPSFPPLLLINGLAQQMINYDEEFCNLLVDKDLYVIRFDNRDVGLSTKFEEAGIPDVMAAMTARAQGKKVQSFYSLDDMADDAIGLMEELSIKKAHIFGMSMGADILQVIGYRHPARVLSLIQIMGTTRNPDLPLPKPEAMQFILTPAPTEREAFIEHSIKMWKVLNASFPFDEAYSRKRVAESYDRAFYPQGAARQLMAIIAYGNRKSRLASITAPTLVIHGVEDPLVPVEGGKDTAEAIPGAKLLLIDKMGHSLPKEAWPQIVEAIAAHTRKAAGYLK